jgi:hypothetical protein
MMVSLEARPQKDLMMTSLEGRSETTGFGDGGVTRGQA